MTPCGGVKTKHIQHNLRCAPQTVESTLRLVMSGLLSTILCHPIQTQYQMCYKYVDGASF